MSGDRRCLVCRGEGTIRDSAGRDEVCPCTNGPKRDMYAKPSVGWVGDALGDVFRRLEAQRVDAEAHALACTARPCARCGRHVCETCREPFDGCEPGKCHRCRDAELLAAALLPMRTSIPKRFRWAFEASTGTLRGRVRGTDELISRALANPPSVDMMLIGDTAMGKTSLAVAMLDAWVRQKPFQRSGARFVESWWLAGAKARHPLGQGESPDIIAAQEATLLVIDDLGSESEDRRGVLAEVIFERHNNELPTWITTGFAATELMGRYGSQVIRRIVEHGKSVTLGSKAA